MFREGDQVRVVKYQPGDIEDEVMVQFDTSMSAPEFSKLITEAIVGTTGVIAAVIGIDEEDQELMFLKTGIPVGEPVFLVLFDNPISPVDGVQFAAYELFATDELEAI